MADTGSFPAVNEFHEPVLSVYTDTPPRSEGSRISLHHYVLKSEEEYRHKVERKSPDGYGKDWGFFTAIDSGCTEENLHAVHLAELCRLPEIIAKQQELIDAGKWR
jgi:hypothetical protein